MLFSAHMKSRSPFVTSHVEAAKSLAFARMVDMRVREGDVGDVGRAVADLRQLTPQCSGHHRRRGGIDVRARPFSAAADVAIGDHAELPHQRPLRMGDQKARHRHPGLADFRRRHVIPLHPLGRDVEEAAVEDVQPHGFGSRWSAVGGVWTAGRRRRQTPRRPRASGLIAAIPHPIDSACGTFLVAQPYTRSRRAENEKMPIH